MLKILIAEDDRELRQLFSHVLMKNGYTVKEVGNGKEALDALGELTGRTAREEIVSRIFSRFCVGK